MLQIQHLYFLTAPHVLLTLDFVPSSHICISTQVVCVFDNGRSKAKSASYDTTYVNDSLLRRQRGTTIALLLSVSLFIRA
jgi:hypothetical protein